MKVFTDLKYKERVPKSPLILILESRDRECQRAVGGEELQWICNEAALSVQVCSHNLHLNRRGRLRPLVAQIRSESFCLVSIKGMRTLFFLIAICLPPKFQTRR